MMDVEMQRIVKGIDNQVWIQISLRIIPNILNRTWEQARYQTTRSTMARDILYYGAWLQVNHPVCSAIRAYVRSRMPM